MIFDMECDGLTNATKIHVLSWEDEDGGVQSTHDYQVMRGVLANSKVLIGHNIILFDIPVIERILGIKIKAKLIDTLALSWYLMPNRIRHGLAEWGEDVGVAKPKVDDWENLSYEEYKHRCEEDVKINRKVYDILMDKMRLLYKNDDAGKRKMVNYLTFKMKTVQMQEHLGWKLDVAKVKDGIAMLEAEKEKVVDWLTEVMPPIEVWTTKSMPAKPYKQDGTLSVAGAKWFKLLKDNGFSVNYNGVVDVLVGTKEPNPNSVPQVKDWLYLLGWKPQTWTYTKDADGNEKKVEQIRIVGEHGKELCPSVKALINIEPAVQHLENISTYQHRIGLLKGFLRDEQGGYLQASMGGFTNTLRLKHRQIVNLPGVDKQFGELIRGCLIADEGKILCGSDMVSLEDTTKRHYMYHYDPLYVNEMAKPGFDPHLDLAIHAGAITVEEIVGGLPHVKVLRKNFKAANYACVYGVGKDRLARDLGITVAEAAKLIKSYWKRNWAIKKLIEDTITKTLPNGEMWLFNPVSRFWYSLRYEKDIFSTLNQSTGVYCFDKWLSNVAKIYPWILGQFHDEGIWQIPKGANNEDEMEQLLLNAIQQTNDQLQLNVKLGVDVQFGNTYAEIH